MSLQTTRGCTTIVVGRKASVDGSVLLAHNEDDGGSVAVKLQVIKRGEHPGCLMFNGSKIYREPRSMLSIRVTWSNHAYVNSRMVGVDFGDSYINEKGVAIVSDSAPSREDRPHLVNGGIRFFLRRIVAEKASSAREGVEIIGSLVEEYGYGHKGRIYVVADSKEAWVVHVVFGRHWVAQRVPDNAVAVIPNSFTIRRVDLSDKNCFMGSKDLVEYAAKRGWYRPARDGEFDFSRAYGDPRAHEEGSNAFRQWLGLYMLTGRDYPLDNLPFAVEPSRKLTFKDLMKVLRSHFEETRYDEVPRQALEKPGGFHRNLSIRPMCVWTTQEASVIQLRGYMPREIGVVYWRAPGIPCINAFIPWYPVAMTRCEAWFPEPYRHADLSHLDTGSAYWVFRILTAMVDDSYRERASVVRRVWEMIEEEAMRLQPYIEECALRLHRDLGEKEASGFLARYSAGLAMEAYDKALELIKKYQA